MESQKPQTLKQLENNFPKIFICYNIILTFVISLAFYKQSLEGCSGAEYECLKGKNLEFLYQKKNQCFYSAFVISILILLSIHKVISFFTLIPIFLIYPILFLFNQGYDFNHHGSYNTLGFIVIIIITISILEISFLIYKLLKKKMYKQLIIVCIIILTPFFLFLIFGFLSCKNWTKGIGDIQIINNKEKDACHIREPKFCTINIFDRWFDLSRFMTCENKANDRKILETFAKNVKDKNYSIFVYPDTRKYNFENDSQVGIFHFKVLDEIESLNITKDKNPEVIVEFDKNNKGTIKINITPNETLIKIRREKAKNHKVKFENILFIYIDALSRNHFKRKLPKTTKFLEKYLPVKNQKIKVFQFMKYSSFKGTTQENVIPMFFGNSLESESGVSIIKYLKEYGYITSGTRNICHKNQFDLQGYKTKNIHFESYDHENVAMMCDPNFSIPNFPFSILKGIYSFFRRCLYGRDTFEYIFDYSMKFWEAYKNERKFSFISFIDAHEGTMEAVQYMDTYFYNYLNNFIHKYYDNNTVIFIASDHGENMVSIHDFIYSEDFQYEKTLGTFFLLFPSDNDDSYENNLNNNQQVFITPYDIHDSIIDFINGDVDYFSKKGISVIRTMNGLKRTCENYKDDFDDLKKYCSCINYK